MANEIVYTSSFYDDNNNLCKVYIKKDGYTGSETSLRLALDEPVVIKWVGNDDDKFTHIKPKEAYINYIATSSLQLLDLFTSQGKTYEVEIYRGVNLVFTGFINPEYYSEEFIDDNHPISVHCIDGLVELKNVKPTAPGFAKADYKQTLIYYVHHCLSKIGYNYNNMDFEIAVNIVAKQYDDNIISSRIFENLYIDYRALKDEDAEWWSCFDVLNEICASFNARLYQNGDAWRIERLDQKYDDFRLELYDDSGSYSSVINSNNEEVALTSHQGRGYDIRFIRGASLEVQPAYKRLEIFQEFGKDVNLLPLSNYEGIFTDDDFSGGMLRHWTANGGMSVNHETDWRALRLEGYITGPMTFNTYIYSDEIDMSDYVGSLGNLMSQWNGGDIIMKFESETFAKYSGWDDDSVQFFIKIIGNFSGTQYTLDETLTDEGVIGEWKVGPTSYNLIGYLYQEDWGGFTVKIPKAPHGESTSQTSIKFQVYLYKGRATSANAGTLDDGICYRRMKLYFQNMQQTRYDGNIEEGSERTIEETIDSNNLLQPPKYDVKFGDTPDPGNRKVDGTGNYQLVNRCVLFDDTPDAVNYFGFQGDADPSSSLIESILRTDLNVTYRRPQFKLRGTIIDTSPSDAETPKIDFHTCLQDYNSRWYIPLSLSYNMRSCTFDGEWLQIWDESGTGEFNDDFSEDFFI